MSTRNIFSLILVLKLSTSLHFAVPPTFRRRSADGLPTFRRRSVAVRRLATLVTPTIKSNFLKRWDGKFHFSSKPGVYLRVLVNYLKLFGIADLNTG